MKNILLLMVSTLLLTSGCVSTSLTRSVRVVERSSSFPKACAWLQEKGLSCEIMPFCRYKDGWIIAVGTTREFAEGASHFERLALLFCDSKGHLWQNRDISLLNDWWDVPADDWWTLEGKL